MLEFLQLGVIGGSVVYLLLLYFKSPKNSDAIDRVDHLKQPIDYSRYKSQDFVMSKDGSEEPHPSGDWWQVANQIVARGREDDYDGGSGLPVIEGRYQPNISEKSFYNPVNTDV